MYVGRVVCAIGWQCGAPNIQPSKGVAELTPTEGVAVELERPLYLEKAAAPRELSVTELGGGGVARWRGKPVEIPLLVCA